VRYRNYKSYSVKTKQSIPNIISESIVDYFIECNNLFPYNINTSIFGKYCNIYLPTTNLIDLKSYLFQDNFELFNTFSEINFFQQKSPIYSDTLHYGNYYGYSTKNVVNSYPIGKHISQKIVDGLSKSHSHICQLTYDTKECNVISITVMTNDRSVSKKDVLNIVRLDDPNLEKPSVSILNTYTTHSEFYTNNNTLHSYHELPTTNNQFIGSDPLSPNRILPLYLRYMSKNIVNSSLMDECLISVNFNQSSITPLSFNINSFGTEKYDMKNIYSCVMDVFQLSIKQMKDKLDFFTPIYKDYYINGFHNPDKFQWEQLDKTKELIIF